MADEEHQQVKPDDDPINRSSLMMTLDGQYQATPYSLVLARRAIQAASVRRSETDRCRMGGSKNLLALTPTSFSVDLALCRLQLRRSPYTVGWGMCKHAGFICSIA